MGKDLHSIYSERKNSASSELQKVTRRINLISNLRLASAVVFLIFVYFSFKAPAAGTGALLAAIVFLLLVRKHSILFTRQSYLQNIAEVNELELRALQYDISGFSDGREFTDPLHAWSYDLDIFGEGSLFQYLNRCTTPGGKSKLAENLCSLPASEQSVLQRQEAIRELIPLLDFRQNLQTAGMQSDEKSEDARLLLEWTRHRAFIPMGRTMELILKFVPVSTLVALFLTLLTPWAKPVLMLLVMFQWIMLGRYFKKINAFSEYIGRKKNLLQKYASLIGLISSERLSSSVLKTAQNHSADASHNIEKLAELVNALNARTNMLVSGFVNSLLMYDLQCVYRLEKWKEKNSSKLDIWLETIAETEALASFATYGFNNPALPFARINKTLTLSAEALAHPLIPAEERIPNDFRTSSAPFVTIITGANMAGKSTFLRTLGTNWVLALNGAPVCAKNFSCPVAAMRTGMRTADSLKDHQSYFYAELNRLKTIIDELKSGKPVFILLDEILKGTNSNDKQAGSIALVKQLLPYPAMVVIATHDLALGELEKEYPDNIRNYCFEANIENDQLSFDYLLKDGVATRMNASFLMKKMGIIG